LRKLTGLGPKLGPVLEPRAPLRGLGSLILGKYSTFVCDIRIIPLNTVPHTKVRHLPVQFGICRDERSELGTESE
jgi:hypothetical protein